MCSSPASIATTWSDGDSPSGTTSSSPPLRTSTIDADGREDRLIDSDASPCAPTATPLVLAATSASSSQKPHEAAQVTRMKAGLDSHSPTVLMK
eukprot:scaffold95772_cov66-Phaeocystis_antarctica.AAC.6